MNSRNDKISAGDQNLPATFMKRTIQMDIINVLQKYRETEEKNLIITNAAGEPVYVSKKMDFPAEVVLSKINDVTDDFDEQEIFDKDQDLFLNIRKSVITDGGETYNCYSFTDVREYALLIKEVSSYNLSVSNMSKFQTTIMKKLSMSYDTFLPGLADYCSAEEVMMFIKKDDKVIRSTYTQKLTRTNVELSGEYAHFFDMKRGDSYDGFTCILNSRIQEHDCVVLVKKSDIPETSDPMDASIHNVIRLFIENSILRDHIIYESEHDKLTGLYNKGKYMELKNNGVGRPGSIAIYNFDVNILKHINDSYGHEYGDALIIKAAKSIASVTSDKVLGFRMGGDEYVMVAVNVSREEAEIIHAQWQASLDRLNDLDKSLFCSMACGISYGSGEYDYDELYAQSDKLMYENKKALKEKGITSHLTGQTA